MSEPVVTFDDMVAAYPDVLVESGENMFGRYAMFKGGGLLMEGHGFGFPIVPAGPVELINSESLLVRGMWR